MTGIVLGIDTSCYTTSVAAVTEAGALVSNRRQLLRVPEGGRGLRQSEMVFQHTRNLPALMALLRADIGGAAIRLVSVSRAPRPVEGSYMPAFLAGEGLARSLGAALPAPVFLSTHQEGHMAAGLYGSGLNADAFLALHVSGGTTELLRVHRRPARMEIERLGGSSDVHAGQLIDRVGVALGLGFPAGPALEKLAQAGDAAHALPVSVRRLADAEPAAEKLAQGGEAAHAEPEAVRRLSDAESEAARRLSDAEPEAEKRRADAEPPLEKLAQGGEAAHAEPEAVRRLSGAEPEAVRLSDAEPALSEAAPPNPPHSKAPPSNPPLTVSFGGAQSQVQRWIEAGGRRSEDIAAEVFSHIARSLTRLIEAGVADTGLTRVLMVGGVMSSELLRADVEKRLQKRGVKHRLYFAQPGLSADNALGIALLGAESLQPF